MNTIERRYIPIDQCQVRSEAGEDKKCVITGTPVLYNRMITLYEGSNYTVMEIIYPEAARDALAVPEQMLLWNHDSSKPMAARKNDTLSVREEQDGVHIDADVSGSVWGRDGYEAIRSNLVDSMSFGFILKRDGYTLESTERDGKEIIVRKIHKIAKIFDFSPVTYAAYKDTDISARGADDILKEIEAEKRKGTREKITALLSEFREGQNG
jgi:HK97 family phage prohead protease